MPTEHSRAALARLIPWFESLSPQSLQRLGDFYAADAHFKDPFNEVQGLSLIHI